jgi:septation ring formation regulator EzrA
MKQYKIVAGDYMKKLAQLQEKFSFPLCDLNKSKKKYLNINTKFLFSITSMVPKIIKQYIENIDLSINGIETTIKTLENTIKEKTTIAIKCQDKYDEARSNLLKNYKNIDKLKDLYMNSISNCEDTILKY